MRLYMDIKEFREKGYLQELNRQFLHPLGLALEITVNDEGNESMSGIWDFREDKEGVYYNLKNSDSDRQERFKEKAHFIQNEMEQRKKARKEILGFEVEPVE